MKTKKQFLGVWIDQDTKNQLKKMAAADQSNVARIVRLAIQDYCKANGNGSRTKV